MIKIIILPVAMLLRIVEIRVNKITLNEIAMSNEGINSITEFEEFEKIIGFKMCSAEYQI